LFVGFAGDLVVGIWVGRDDNKSLGKITGGSLPARIWHQFMASAVAIDGRAGPSLPRRYPAPGERERPPVQNPSPLPEDWSEASRPFRDLMRELEKLVE
jgi:penicillin-binding protein 1A